MQQSQTDAITEHKSSTAVCLLLNPRHNCGTMKWNLSSSLYVSFLAILLFSTTLVAEQQAWEAPSGVESIELFQTARKFLDNIESQNVKTFPYIPASIPMRLYECLRDFSMLRCMKAYLLQKLEERPNFVHTGNLTRDFLNQFFGNEQEMGSLVDGKYKNISDKQLNQQLLNNFQRFFNQRDIKLHFLPGLMVKVIPSKENKLKFTLRKSTYKKQSHGTGRALTKNDEEENISGTADAEIDGEMKRPGIGIAPLKKKKNQSYKQTMIQMAVPVMILPAILMGSFLPFVLPVLKMATIMSMIMNNSAFLAALLYAARTHANSQEEQPINYGYSGFH